MIASPPPRQPAPLYSLAKATVLLPVSHHIELPASPPLFEVPIPGMVGAFNGDGALEYLQVDKRQVRRHLCDEEQPHHEPYASVRLVTIVVDWRDCWR